MARILSPLSRSAFLFGATDLWGARFGRRAARLQIGPLAFGYFAAFADVAAIVAAAVVTVLAYNLAVGERFRGLSTGLTVGLIFAVLTLLVAIHRGDYAQNRYNSVSGQIARTFPMWNSTTLAALALGVATRAIADFPRLELTMFYAIGFVCMVLARRGVAHGLSALKDRGLAAPRRVAIVGFEQEIGEFAPPGVAPIEDASLVCSFALRETDSFFADDLALAVAAVRWRRPDDVFIALPWSRADLIEACVAAFAKSPVEVHLGLGSSLQQWRNLELARVGQVAGLTLMRKPLGRLELVEKRVFDLMLSTFGLIALAPLFGLVALAIRLESRGPVLFRQNRYGHNQQPFRIFKFRSMRALDNGAVVKQATRSDPRVTRVGSWLRRLSIDELPQLINVWRGEMSIVGPRPHALAHDQFYFDKLARYARRHNVKPGITGWAQVNGHRGEIADASAMLARLEHDLYYIDHWSIWLDLKIVFMTVFSHRAHSNAY